MSVVFTPTPTNHASVVEYDDGDAPSAANINPLGEAAFDCAKWAANHIGATFLVWETVYDAGAGTATMCSSVSQFWNNVAGNNYKIASFAVNFNDVVEVICNPVVLTDAASPKVAEARVGYSLDGGTTISGSVREVKLAVGAAPTETQITVLGRMTMAATDTIDLYLQARSPDDTTAIELLRPCQFLVKLWRPTT